MTSGTAAADLECEEGAPSAGLSARCAAQASSASGEASPIPKMRRRRIVFCGRRSVAQCAGTKGKELVVDMNTTEMQRGVISIEDVQQRIIRVREQPVIIDADVASLYGVETKRVNEAVRNNPEKFPGDYMFELDDNESRALRSKFSSLEHAGKGRHSKYNFKAFTEKGLYMLATVLKSKRATAATFAIIETFAKVCGLKRELVELHKEEDGGRQADKCKITLRMFVT